MILATVSLCATWTVSAAIPQGEREDLIALYTSAGGNGWSNNTNWCSGACPAVGTPTVNAPGTECTWFGIVCDASNSHVISINLPNNKLIGNLPVFANLGDLQLFVATNNNLSGPIPSLTRLTQLDTFWVYSNQLSGHIPSLAGLTHLFDFRVNHNQLDGSIPSLIGLTSLQRFDVGTNNLTGPIPSLTGLINLDSFLVGGNKLTGPVPAVPTTGHPNFAILCPNRLDLTPTANDTAWNTATGTTPWWATPFRSNRCDDLFNTSFESLDD